MVDWQLFLLFFRASIKFDILLLFQFVAELQRKDSCGLKSEESLWGERGGCKGGGRQEGGCQEGGCQEGGCQGGGRQEGGNQEDQGNHWEERRGEVGVEVDKWRNLPGLGVDCDLR